MLVDVIFFHVLNVSAQRLWCTSDVDRTSSTPASIAASSPLRLGVKAAYLTPGARRILPTTSRPSAIWGTHLGLTKDAASIVPHPASDKRSIKPT